jgi:tetratricopeptide (TPR) repeat protein
MEDQAFELYMNYLNSGQPAKALTLALSWITTEPEKWDGYYFAGLAYRAKNEFDKAIEYYLRALSLRPNESAIYLNLGVAYQLAEQYDRSVEALEKAIELDGYLTNAYNSLGLTYRLMGNYDKALEYYDRGLKKMVGSLYNSMKNKEENERVEPFADEGSEWGRLALDVAVYHAAKDNIEDVRFPTALAAQHYYSSNEYGGLYYYDSITEEGKVCRYYLPNYFEYIHRSLVSTFEYPNMLRNKAITLRLLGEKEESDKLMDEAYHYRDFSDIDGTNETIQQQINMAKQLKENGKIREAYEIYDKLYEELNNKAADYARGIKGSIKDEGDNRIIMPQYMSKVMEYLKRNKFTCIIANKMGEILAESGEIEGARGMFMDAIQFTPENVNYPDPHISLKKLPPESSE